MALSKSRLREIAEMVDLCWRMTREATAPDASEEVIIMAAAMQSTLALDIAPELIAEIERLRTAGQTLALAIRDGSRAVQIAAYYAWERLAADLGTGEQP